MIEGHDRIALVGGMIRDARTFDYSTISPAVLHRSWVTTYLPRSSA